MDGDGERRRPSRYKRFLEEEAFGIPRTTIKRRTDQSQLENETSFDENMEQRDHGDVQQQTRIQNRQEIPDRDDVALDMLDPNVHVHHDVVQVPQVQLQQGMPVAHNLTMVSAFYLPPWFSAGL